ncbi:MAG: alpha/beta hydrolase [Archangium sp.]|nr:alpha/beta hydrolase [Archangium sp.]
MRAFVLLLSMGLVGCAGAGPTHDKKAFFQRVDLPRWQRLGIDATFLTQALDTTHSMSEFFDDVWVKRWLDEGKRLEAIAVALEAANDPSAGKAYADAARYYIVAHYPNPKTPLKKEAFEASLRTASKGMALGGIAFDPIDFAAPMGQLHVVRSKPLGDGVKRPVILVSGGLDGYKEELALLLQGSLAGSGVSNGVVLVLVDMPGTGQNPRPLSSKGHEEYSAIIDRLASEPDIDSTRIGFMGLSFGGYWAVRLPQVEPRIKAAVNFGGPMTKAFTLGNFGRLPDAFVQAALQVMGVKDIFGLAGVSDSLAKSVSDGLASNTRPLLTINGTEDSVIPMEDTLFPYTAGAPRTFFLVPGDDHCAMGNLELVIGVAKSWLDRELAAP